MENSECKKKRGRKIGNCAKWSKLRYHIEIKGFGNNPNVIVGDFPNRVECAKELSKILGFKISAMVLFNVEQKRTRKFAHEVIISKL